MINLSNLKPRPGSNKRRKVIGRGRGSGHGKTSTKGDKGQKARSGGHPDPRFEGGQMPIIRRLPKRGFKNPFRIAYTVVNLKSLESLIKSGIDGEVTPQLLKEKGIVKTVENIKVLGDGAISKPLTIHAAKFSKSALKKIEGAGGKAILIQ
jgi:large subunit ribosomal protein L15